ncbi:hypothetical protein BGW80DRAFT_1248869 [Lactifluus volemus]|nr:hypothetical protein BGW80DRAFT_1248869 [Lactifluus volemus]
MHMSMTSIHLTCTTSHVLPSVAAARLATPRLDCREVIDLSRKQLQLQLQKMVWTAVRQGLEHRRREYGISSGNSGGGAQEGGEVSSWVAGSYRQVLERQKDYENEACEREVGMIVGIESLTAKGDSRTGMIGPAGPGDWGTIYWNCWFPVLVALKVIEQRQLLRQVQGQQQRGGRHHHWCWDKHDHTMAWVDEAEKQMTKEEKKNEEMSV